MLNKNVMCVYVHACVCERRENVSDKRENKKWVNVAMLYTRGREGEGEREHKLLDSSNLSR